MEEEKASELREKKKKFFGMFEKFREHKGSRIIGEIEQLKLSNYILTVNYIELGKVISHYEKSPSIWYEQNRSQLDVVQKEFLRRTHNYVASISSLVDHTRKFKGRIGDEEFSVEYETRLEQLREDENILFLQDLRLYCQHYQTPLATAVWTFKSSGPPHNGKGDIMQKLLLSSRELEMWKEWKDKSKSLIQKGDVDVKDVSAKYQTTIEDFYNWFYTALMKVYSEELAARESMRITLKKMEQEIREYDPKFGSS